MQAVELLDGEHSPALDDDRGDPGATDALPTRRRRRRWWMTALVAVLVLALGGTQRVIQARENAAVARLAAVSGVIPRVEGPLDVVTRYSSQEAAHLGGQGGILVRGPDGSLTYQWGAGTVDDPGWTKQLLGPVPALAGSQNVYSSSMCLPDTDPQTDVSQATRAVCLITDGGMKSLEDGGRLQDVPATMTFVELLDTAAGAPLARWPAPGAQSIAVVDGHIIVGSIIDTADVFSSRDMLSGDARWIDEVPLLDASSAVDLPTMMSRHAYVSRAGDLIAATTSAGELRLLRPDGHVERQGLGGDNTWWSWQINPSNDRLILTSQDGAGHASATLLAPNYDPSADHIVQGQVVPVRVDDGSVSGLLLTTDPALRAWDDTTGAARWSSEDAHAPRGGGRPPDALIVRGRVYVLSQGEVFALDGHTGKTLWKISGRAGLQPATLLTDAHHLLVGCERPANDGDPLLVSYDLTTGDEVSHVAYPNGIAHLAEWDSTLMGYDETYAHVAALG